MREIVLGPTELFRASSALVLLQRPQCEPGVHRIEPTAGSQTVTIGYDETTHSETDLRLLVQECGYHGRGEVVPYHLCSINRGKTLPIATPRRNEYANTPVLYTVRTATWRRANACPSAEQTDTPVHARSRCSGDRPRARAWHAVG